MSRASWLRCSKPNQGRERSDPRNGRGSESFGRPFRLSANRLRKHIVLLLCGPCGPGPLLASWGEVTWGSTAFALLRRPWSFSERLLAWDLRAMEGLRQQLTQDARVDPVPFGGDIDG
jgi:hypothetical protein